MRPRAEGQPWAAKSESLRRRADIAIALVVGTLTIQIMLAIALLVCFKLGRPIFFVQERAGLKGSSFRLVKFRTMSEIYDGSGRLLTDAARTSGLGQILRRTRLDELPELWNVLVGDMSVIGPRPLLPTTVDEMGEDGVYRCSVQPGLTGWAQVSGNSKLSDTEKLALDFWYIRNKSLWLDIRILLETVKFLILGDKVDVERVDLAQRQVGPAASSRAGKEDGAARRSWSARDNGGA